MADAGPISVLGTGRMGAAIVDTLRRAGFHVVVYNRTRSRAEEVAATTGAVVARTAREAASSATVILSSLADDRAVRDVYGGPDGAGAGLRAGSTVVEMSTIAPETLHELESTVVTRSSALLDAPMSGSIPHAEKGELTFMVGGDVEALERVRPVLDALAKKVIHVGSLGRGSAMKLAANTLTLAINVAVSESLVLAERAGIDRATAYEVLSSGAGAAPFVHYKRDAFERPEGAPVAFSVNLSAKDLDLILQLAEHVGVLLRQATTNREIFRDTIEAGLGEHDMSAVAVRLRATAQT